MKDCHVQTSRNSIPAVKSGAGFTLLELMLVLAIIGTLAAIAIPNYIFLKEQTKVDIAISDVKNLESEILVYFTVHDKYPDSLADIGRDGFKDPWGNPYQYLKIEGGDVKGKGKLRKDHAMVPVNSDYDLYSVGADGDSQSPFTAKASQDDIIRCGNGSYIGLVSNY